ncbi:MAG TPA: EF-P lysine aminoacylase EpmA [Pirellulaceae bacterium]|nr:EF-P lysine aminoacylase EpmA [Pirellulaceae bacterium]
MSFRPTASWDNLRRRAELLRRLRSFFDDRGFLEVETPVLSADTVVDRHLDPLGVILFDDPRQPQVGRQFWLQTSPEYGMKRLLAAGATAIYQVTRAFRGGEVGRIHNPEFTMVEWYRTGDDYAAGRALLSDLAATLLDRGLPEQLTYAAAFERYAGIEPHRATESQLAELARARGLTAPAFEPGDRDGWLHWLLAELVEPHLGRAAPTLLYDYPASQAALAQVRPDDPPVAERFELYVDGIELANGYHELLDPKVLSRRTEEANLQRAADGKYELPAHSRLQEAMDHGLPACTGVALGFDRLVMVALGATSLAEVQAFPTDRA